MSPQRNPRLEVSDRLSDGLLQQVIGGMSHDRSDGLVIALTSIDPRAGVGYFTTTFADELGADNEGSVLCLDSRILEQLHRESGSVHPSILSRLVPDTRPLPEDGSPLPVSPPWRDGQSFRRATIERLRLRFQYILISCPPLIDSSDVLNLAGMVDGVILIVEANRTQTRQIAVVERTITAARGRILGHILNKRAYFIPQWVFKRLGKFGV